jgi:hypothetical protein
MDDPLLMPQSRPAMTGRKAIRALYKSFFEGFTAKSLLDLVIKFKTKTREYTQDWDDNNVKMTTHLYCDRLLGNEIEFDMKTYSGFSSNPPVQFTAQKSSGIANYNHGIKFIDFMIIKIRR